MSQQCAVQATISFSRLNHELVGTSLNLILYHSIGNKTSQFLVYCLFGSKGIWKRGVNI